MQQDRTKDLFQTFSNVPFLYGDQMRAMSGGLVYEFTQESDNYSLASLNNSAEVTIPEDFKYLMEQYVGLDESKVTAMGDVAASSATISCAAGLVSESAFSNAWDLPSRLSGGNKLVKSGVSSEKRGVLLV